MAAYLRHKRIFEIVCEREFIKFADLKEEMGGIPDSTLKRDLKTMEENGLIKRVHGGAVKLPGLSAAHMEETPMEKKSVLYTEEKERIARFAASLVEEQDVIYVDASSTVTPMLRYLEEKPLTVVTSSVYVLKELKSDRHRAIILGGEYNRKSQSVVGSYTETMLSGMYFHKAFVGANGFADPGGITTPDFRESVKKQMICKNSDIAYFLMDGSKEGVRALCKSLELAEANLITDRENSLLDKFRSYHIAP